MNTNNKLRIVISMMTIVVAASVGLVFAANDPAALGVIAIEPILEETSIAIALELEEGQAVTGLRWYNNDSATVFPYVMALAGIVGEPPNLADAVVIFENVSGQEEGWSELDFGQSVVSPTSLFYVVFQLPANAQVVGRGDGPGIGYANAEDGSKIYITAEGLDWSRMTTSKKLLVEPIISQSAEKSSNAVLLLPSPTALDDDASSENESEVAVYRTELFGAYPNPFNPVTRIVYAVRSTSAVDIKIYDVSGRQVRSVRIGQQSPGQHEFLWKGDDDSGLTLPKSPSPSKTLNSG